MILAQHRSIAESRAIALKVFFFFFEDKTQDILRYFSFCQRLKSVFAIFPFSLKSYNSKFNSIPKTGKNSIRKMYKHDVAHIRNLIWQMKCDIFRYYFPCNRKILNSIILLLANRMPWKSEPFLHLYLVHYGFFPARTFSQNFTGK